MTWLTIITENGVDIMDKAKDALWTKSFVLDTLINFLVFLIYYLLIVIIAVVAKDNLYV